MAEDDRPGPVEVARELTEHLFGAPRAVWIGGSVVTGHRMPASDLDIVVVTADRAVPYRQSFVWRGWPIELLVHDEATLKAYCEHGFARRRPTIPRIIADGETVLDGDGLAARLRPELRARIAEGPRAPGPVELDSRRYDLTDLLADLSGSTDPDETAMIGWHVLTGTAELALLARRHWLGRGKWLLRELRDLDPDLAGRLMRAREDPGRLAGIAREVLDGAGGPLWDGHHAPGPRDPGSTG